MSRLERAKEFASPVSGVHARMRFVAVMNDDGLGVVGDAVASESITARERFSGQMHHGGLDVLRAVALLLLLDHFGALHADTMG